MKDIKNKEIIRDFKTYDLFYLWGGYGEGNGYRYGYRHGEGFGKGYYAELGDGYWNGLGNGNGVSR